MSHAASTWQRSQGLRARILQGPVLLSAVLGFGQLLGLLRTTAVARYLGTEIQGDAVVIGMITGFFGSVFTLNAAWQLIQSPRHDQREFSASLHASTLIRGIAATLLIAIASAGILYLLGRSNLVLPMILASMVPAIEGFMNLDAWRLIRHGRYRRLAAVELSGPLCSILAAIAILIVTRSIWVIPVVATGTSLGRVVASHALATRSWRPRLHRNDVREIVQFSLPLIPAGILFWLNTQSDRLVILISEKIDWMQRFDTRDLGAYGTVAMIVLLPRGTIVKTMQSVIVPRISSSRADPATLERSFRHCWLAVGSLSLAIATLGAITGRWVLGLALGSEFRPGVDVAGLLITAMGLQLVRTFAYNSSTGMGNTVTILVGNSVRMIGVVLAVIAAWQHLGLRGLAWSVISAECLATLAAGYWLNRILPSAFSKIATGVIVIGLMGLATNLLI